MIKVRILTGMTAASAAAFALPALAGCTATADDAVSTGTENNTESIAGSGEIVLHGWSLNYQSTSGGDEFVRVGERLKSVVDFNDTVSMVAHGDAALQQELRSDPSKLSVDLVVKYTRGDGTTFDAAPLPLAWKPGPSNQLAGSSNELVIPSGVRALAIDFVARFERAGIPQSMNILQSQNIPSEFVVFGAYAPNKVALFDTVGADRRTRVIEGGKIVPGSHATVAVTDWRLDTVVEKYALDLRCGQKTSGSRFGPVVVDAMGELEYEVSAAISTDGGATYEPVGLAKVVKPPVFARADGFRYTLEHEVQIPQNAGPSMKVAFHVRAFLQVPAFAPGELSNARYAPNARILLKDVWDNNGGKDYALPIGSD
jgi:hypothetical protein